MGPRFALLLAATAVAAALVAVAPLLLSGSGDRVCRNPDHPQTSFTRAAPSGAHVVGYTEFADGAADTVHFVGITGPESVDAPRLQIRGGGTRELVSTDIPGCYVVDGSIPPDGALLVTANTASEEIRARILRERLNEPTEGLIATTRRATAALTGLREQQAVGRRADGPREAVRVVYADDGYRVTSASGSFRQDVENWQGIFYWSAPSTFTSATAVGRETVNGRELVRVSGFVPVPLWLEILVDPKTGNVYRQDMLAAQHFMNSRFSDFRRR